KQNPDIRELITESRFYLHKIMDTAFISFSIIHLICFSFKHLSPESTVNQLLLCKGEGYKAQ
ncbi:hypothetical protein, partial [Bacteroides uniformis]|uniref:hypothetical protein n=1 Tax=Bacteroides uniformis TaxID=820 RepID=UPI0039B69BC3